jgi:hypothetical protein
VINELFQAHTHLAVHITTSAAEAEAFSGSKICYAQTCTIAHAMHIIPHGLLDETNIKQQRLTVLPDSAWTYTFFQTSGSIPFDVLSAAFYLLSRYEEYLPFNSDKHGRFPHQSSLAYRSGFLQTALVDRWRLLLLSQLGLSQTYAASFTYQATIDIDHAFLYTGVSVWRQVKKALGSCLRGHISDVYTQLQVCFGNAKDPYDTYDTLQALAEQYNQPLTYFILCGSNSAYDASCNTTHHTFHQLIKKLSQKANIGLHPSYESMHKPEYLLHEKWLLEQLIHKPVALSRQHYLRFTLPKVYQQLMHAGISSDHSMGYANTVGFRASTALPFLAYDCENDCTLPITVYPVTVMDTSLRYGMQLQPHAAMVLCKQLMDEVKSVNGQFISIWHNSNTSHIHAWHNWYAVYVYLYNLAYGDSLS